MRPFLRLLAIAVIFTGTAVRAQDPPAAEAEAEKTQTIQAEGVSFEVPADWESSKPTSAMRKAQVTAPAAEGDEESAELLLYVFPGGAGTVEANVDRWQKQFSDEEGDTPEVETETVKAGDLDVTRVECSGTYRDPFAAGGPREDYRLLGAILQTESAGYYFKMVGPSKTMEEAEAGFDAMIKSLKLDQ